MSKKEKKMNNVIEPITLDIPEDEIWTYRIEGLAAPHINKPYKHATLKKIAFALVIIVAVSLSMYFSLRTVTTETFEYKQTESGYQLSQFTNPGSMKELTIDYVSEIEIAYPESEINQLTGEKGTATITITPDKSKPITSIREYALNCDGVVQVINIGADVLEIDGKAFYSCWALQRIEVDENNPNYCSVNGVLYSKDMTKVICVPCDHDTYRAELTGNAVYAKIRDSKGNIVDDPNKTTRVDPDVLGYKINGELAVVDIFDSSATHIWQFSTPDEYDSEEEIAVYHDQQQQEPIEEIKVIAYRQKSFIDKLLEKFGKERQGSIKAYQIFDLEGNVLTAEIVGFRTIDLQYELFAEGTTFESYTNDVYTYVIPNSVTTVGQLAFNYSNMSTLYLPEGLKEIETLGFYEIPKLVNVYSYKTDKAVTDTRFTSQEDLGEVYLSLPEGLEIIGSDAFTECMALTYMYIPESVKTIGHHAFWATCYNEGDDIKGVNIMNVAASEEAFDEVECGDQWRPQYDYMLFNKSIDISYSAERQAIN